MTYQATIAEPNASLVLKLTAGVDKHIVAHMDIAPKVGIERREDSEIIRNPITEQFGEYLPNFFEGMLAVV